jgi:DNA (cytosine-5)-methyltransferase 1
MIGVSVGSLFSGIGGLELGLEWAGLGPVVWQCEIDPFCRAVLAKHWPNVTRFHDVTERRHWPKVDLICGGFPCQDVSSAGARKGIRGERSGLWFQFARIVSEVRPAWVVVENVASGVRAWLPTVRRHLCQLGYRTRPVAVSAADVGAPHLRRRVFVVAHAHGKSEPPLPVDAKVGRSSALAADPPRVAPGRTSRSARSEVLPDIDGLRERGESVEREAWGQPWSRPQPEMVRVVHGLPRRLDAARRRALGNAVVPQCAEVVGRVILEGLRR